MEKSMLSELQKEEILELISLKQEGAYWDFKKEWYECYYKARVWRRFKRCMRSAGIKSRFKYLSLYLHFIKK